MIKEKKYLGINQPLPFRVLEEVLYNLLNNETISKEHIIRHLKEYMNGENMLSKASSQIGLLSSTNENIIITIRKNVDGEAYLRLSHEDRVAFLISLIALTYPVAYELMNILATGFKVQSKVNRAFIDQKMTASYGSNRSIYNAIKAVLSILIDFGILKREKVGLYSLEERKVIQNPNLAELYIYTDIKLSGSKSILVEDLVGFPPSFGQFFSLI
jgi:hypothetical protein